MTKSYRLLLLFLSLIILPVTLFAQTWKPLGPDENQTPSVTFSAFTTIAIAPDGTPYIAYNDNSNNEAATVKKYDGTKWVTVGKPGFTNEGYFASGISLATSPDGTPYIAYTNTPTGANYVSLYVRKLSNGDWVHVGPLIGSGITPTLTIASDGTPYVAFDAGFTGVGVDKFLDGWHTVGDTISRPNLTGNTPGLDNGSKIVIAADGTPYVAFAAAINRHKMAVKKFVAGAWQLVGQAGFSNPGASNVAMTMANDGTIYVAYQDSTNSNKAIIQQYKNGAWSVMTPAGISVGAATDIDLAISPAQIPYIIFTDAGIGKKATVMQLNNGNWVGVGAGVISAAGTQYCHIAIAPDGTPYVTYQDAAEYDKMMVKKFSGNAWVDVADGGVSQEASNHIKLATTKTGGIYVAFNDAVNNGHLSVKQFQQGDWQYVGQPGISDTSPQYLDMTTAPDGTPYVIYKDTTSLAWKTIVKKFSGLAWAQVGGEITNGFGTTQVALAFAGNGTPYAAFGDQNQNSKISVQQFSGSAWTSVGTPSFSTNTVKDINIAIDNSNVPYVAYTDLFSTQASVQKYANGAWAYVGSENFTPAGTRDINMVLAADGTPYIAYYDPNKGKVAVEAYTNNSWTFVGGATVSDSSASVPKLVFDKNGQLYICFLQSKSVTLYSTAKVKKLVNNQWVDAGNQSIMPFTAEENAMAVNSDGNLVYAYLNPQPFVRIQTSDDLPAAPVITSCSPVYGGTGTVVTITGFNFSNATAVKFGEANAASYTVISPTQISALVGPGATGLISVTTANGTGTYQSFNFTAPPPVITSFSPASGTVNTVVTIRGKNFGATAAENIVYFGAVTAPIIAASDSVIQVKVPSGSTYQPITVTARQLTGYAYGAFDVTFKSKPAFDANSFAVKKDFAVAQTPLGLVVADFDNDGQPDIATFDDGSSILRNTSTKSGIALTAQKINESASTIATIADMDGDGKTDIVTDYNYGAGILKNKSTGGNFSFYNMEAYRPNNYSADVAAGDIDGDGRPDVATATKSDFPVAIFLNSSTLSNYIYLDDEVDINIDSFPLSVTLADLDGDGKPEMITTITNFADFSGAGLVIIYKNNSTPGKISFTKVAQYSTGIYPKKPVIADIDGDGKPDIILANTGDNTVEVYRNQSAATIAFAAGVTFATGGKPNAVCVADLNGDKNPDLATANSGDNTVSVLKNSSTAGNISFAAKVDYATGSQPMSIAAADLDADSAPEIIVTNYFGNSISVLHNNLVTQSTDSITFKPLTNVTYGDKDITLTATSTDLVNAISFTSSDNTIVSILPGNKAHILKAGSVIITAQQLNGSTPAVSQNLTVLPAPITITADNKTKLKGAANPVFTLQYKSFVNGDDTTAFISKPAITTTATVTSPAGIYPITVTGGQLLNYIITFVSGTLTIDTATTNPPVTDTITFAPLAAVTYGDPDITFAASSTNSANAITYTSSNASVLSIIAGNKGHILKTGNAVITAQQIGGTAAAVTQALTVLPAKMIITADNKTKLAGAVNPVLTVTYKSFVNGDDTTAFISPPVVTTMAITSSPVGAYPITVSGAQLTNYFITYVSGTLTIDSIPSIPVVNQLNVNKAVSPNGDGIDDYLNIDGINNFPSNKVIIINRDGMKLFELAGYDNQNKVFDGHSNITGALLQQGSYFYLIEYVADGKNKRKTGYFVLKY